jgi:hypothetical protein
VVPLNLAVILSASEGSRHQSVRIKQFQQIEQQAHQNERILLLPDASGLLPAFTFARQALCANGA